MSDPELDQYALSSTAREMNYYRGYYSQLIGAKVVGVKVSVQEDLEDGNPFFAQVWSALVFEKDGVEFTCEISKDEEGNGPGFMFGLKEVRVTQEFLSATNSMSIEQLNDLIELLSKKVDKEMNYANKES